MKPLLFSTKRVEFDGKECNIVLQNENGPCLLLALANILILSREYEYVSEKLRSLVSRGTDISLNELLDAIANIGMEISAYTQDESSGSSDLDITLRLLPTLHTGLNINPKFDGSFQDTPEMSVFNLFKIHVIHMWLMPEGDPKIARLREMSHEEAQDLLVKAGCTENWGQEGAVTPDGANIGRKDKDSEVLINSIKIQEFLESSPTQMTAAGMEFMQKTLRDENFYILFRNNHFSTIYFHNGTLYILVTDLGYANERNIVWETLSSIDGSTNKFCGAKFDETSLDHTNQQDKAKDSVDEECANDEIIALQLQYQEDQTLQDKHKDNKIQNRQKKHPNVPSHKDAAQKDIKRGSNALQNGRRSHPSPVIQRKKDSGKCVLV